jgi:amino acid permease
MIRNTDNHLSPLLANSRINQSQVFQNQTSDLTIMSGSPSVTKKHHGMDFTDLDLKPALSSNFQCFLNTAKLFMGGLFLSMPMIFSRTGWLGGVILYSVIGLLNTYTMRVVLRVAQRVSEDRGTRVKSLSDLAYKIYGAKVKLWVDICLFIVQFSVCVSFLYFVSSQMVHVIKEKTGTVVP